MNQRFDIKANLQAKDVREYVNANTYFTGACCAEVLAASKDHVRLENDRLCFIAGPEGIGKTSILNQLRSELADKTCCVSFEGYFDNLNTLLELLMRKLGLVETSAQSVQQCMVVINRAMEGFQDKRPLLLLFDDAHQMPVALIRRLAELVRKYPDRLRIVMAVDNEAVANFDELVKHQRINSLSMRRIKRQELQAYLAHRYGPDLKFDELELGAIYQESEGLPKRINQSAAALTSNRVLQSGSPPLELPTLAPLPSAGQDGGHAVDDWSLQHSAGSWPAEGGSLNEGSIFAGGLASERRSDANAAYIIALGAAACLTAVVALLTLSGGLSPGDSHIRNVQSFDPLAKQSLAAGIQAPLAGTEPYSRPNVIAPSADMLMPGTFTNERVVAYAGEQGPSAEAQQNISGPLDSPDVLEVPLQSEAKVPLSDEQLLLAAEPEHFVLQFVSGSSKAAVRRFTEQHRSLNLRMFASRVNGKTVYKAVSADFPSANSARLTMSTLPIELRKDKPWIRSMASVHKEILRSRPKPSAAEPLPPGSQLAVVN